MAQVVKHLSSKLKTEFKSQYCQNKLQKKWINEKELVTETLLGT
jgi:hypothetical protein